MMKNTKSIALLLTGAVLGVSLTGPEQGTRSSGSPA